MAKKRARREVKIADSEETTSFINSLQDEFPTEPRSTAEKERLRKYLAESSQEKLRSIMRRALMIMVQHPAPAEVQTAGKPTRRKARKA